PNSMTLTATKLTGLGMSNGISYDTLENLNIHLGPGSSLTGNTINVQSTSGITSTSIDTGTGADRINVGSLAPGVGGRLNTIAGGLTINGQGGKDIMTVDDTGNTTGNTGSMTGTTITGLGMGSAGITYSYLEILEVSLGSGGDTFTVTGTMNDTSYNKLTV